MPMSRWARAFIDLNRDVCQRIERHLPARFAVNLHRSYEAQASKLLNSGTGWLILDIGGGKMCPYLRFLDPATRHRVVAIDIAEDELRRNSSVPDRIAADAVLPLPIRDGITDIISSRSVMEHIRDNRSYVANCAQTLKPGGYILHSFPCRYAPFAMANRLLPEKIARGLLYYFYPGWQDECGFKAYYNNCYPSAMHRLLEDNGFEIVHRELRYYQSIYYTFFVPLYLVMVLYDLTVWKLGVENLACQMLFVARKKV